jgi:hypothetical protein
LSIIIEPEDPLESDGVDPLVEPDDVVLLVEPVGTKLTASTDVMQPPYEVVLILAMPLKL